MVRTRTFEDRPGPNGAVELAPLRAAWRELAGRGPEAVAVGDELLGRWGEEHRRYHTLTHLWETLRAVDVLVDQADDPDAVRYAAWFHDAVYEGRPGEDEHESARLAERLLTELGVDPARVREVVRLVEATADHRTDPGDADGAVLCDADLAVLASAPDEYLAYTAAVRAEYRRVPDRLFREGRLSVLRSLRGTPYLYATPYGRTHWEERARANIDAEIERLEAAEEVEPPHL
ncbi:metal-dependent phosphohydrolase [Nocardiopsis sp. EMB25]|uniref:HD domain-containing protein n=1 Tax=Nocardiopsis sp. EMB25 TaxID=2835867 RepID=UPI00228404F3|nr:metal-dependent phosphohydrolase [Nocardiopsis sp. EMB25]MCY9782801.1 metal-dependent phosphohydrolase [Nocardiopsis sp. EMB25]